MQKLQLSIPEPCHENWQQMTATEKGRFCNACAKEVVDFSKMTDIQVLNYFTTITNENVCGRALPEQLDRTISRTDTPKKKLFWYWNYIIMFFMLFGKGNAVKAQGGIRPGTEITPVKQNDIRGQMVAGETGSRVISGKVTDIDGNPISFASIKIKGTNTGVSADANGVYMIKVSHNDILIISGASFMSIEVPVGMKKVVNVSLEYAWLGGIIFVSTDEYYGSLDFAKQVAVLKVKDEESGKLLPNVSVVINSNFKTDTVFTDRKGVYKIKGVKEYEKCFIRLSADGYEPAEFTISGNEFKDKKKEWEVLLRKQKVETVRSTAIPKPGTESRIRMGGVSSVHIGALYVLDGIIMKHAADINPDDVDNIFVLQGPAAEAIYGPQGAGGAIIITTKKYVVSLDTLVVQTYTNSVFGGMFRGVQVKATVVDTLKLFANKIMGTGAIKVFPNPVQRGEQFNLTLKLKQTGLYQIQITDAAGIIVLQKQVKVNTKDITEKIIADSRWSSGTYYISIFDNKNILIYKRGLIVR